MLPFKRKYFVDVNARYILVTDAENNSENSFIWVRENPFKIFL